MKRKLALVGYQLDDGGLERVMSNLSVMLNEKGIEIHVIILEDKISYQYSGILYNIGSINKLKNKFTSKIYTLYLLKKYLKENEFDFVIDFRYRLNSLMEIFLSKFIYNKNVIYTVHSSKIYNYFPSSKFITSFIVSKKHKVVCVSEGIKELMERTYHLNNLVTIHNSIDFKLIDKVLLNAEKLLNFNYIIAVGRLDDITNVKQFDKLIKAYSKSDLIDFNIHLVILGEGNQKEILSKLSKSLKIDKYVHLLGYVQNPFIHLKYAKFLVLSSKYEGFGMVLLEALASSTPVISFDCEFGPNEIIINQKNGILVSNQDFNQLTLAMNKMATDDILYDECKKNARTSVLDFSNELIVQKWLNIVN